MIEPTRAGQAGRVRVLGVIARMNIGGPAHQVSLLYGHIDSERYETLLVVGRPAPEEGSFDHLASRHGAHMVRLEPLSAEISPLRDLRALLGMVRIIRRFRPDVVHTHTAKAGFIGRTAALLALRPRPVIVHSFHGHVLEGYFGAPKSAVFRMLERVLGRLSDALVAVSEATADDLARLGVSPRAKITVIPLGMDFLPGAGLSAASGESFRRELGVGADQLLAVSIGRLVPIKRIDVMLEGVALAIRHGFAGHVAVVGDGEDRAKLEALAADLGLTGRVTFTGFRTDLESILSAADLTLLTSDNEGTPVSLIEAAAAGVPALATAVGGVPEVVGDGAGLLIPPGDPGALAEALLALGADRGRLATMGAHARAEVGRWALGRMLGDFDRLYRTLLAPQTDPLA